MQNLFIIFIVAVCAVFIGRRFYRNLKNSGEGGNCGCSCTHCGPDLASSCKAKSPGKN